MSGFPAGRRSRPAPPVGPTGGKDCRFELSDLGRDNRVPFRRELFVDFSLLGIASSFVTKDFSVSKPQRCQAAPKTAWRALDQDAWEDNCHSGMPLAYGWYSGLSEVLRLTCISVAVVGSASEWFSCESLLCVV